MPGFFSFDTKVDSRALERLIAQFPDELEEVVEVTGRNVEENMKILAPVKTGNLEGSIESRKENPAERHERVVGPTAEYAIFVEFGTRHMAAQPYVTPAAEAETQPFKDAIVALIEKRR